MCEIEYDANGGTWTPDAELEAEMYEAGTLATVYVDPTYFIQSTSQVFIYWNLHRVSPDTSPTRTHLHYNDTYVVPPSSQAYLVAQWKDIYTIGQELVTILEGNISSFSDCREAYISLGYEPANFETVYNLLIPYFPKLIELSNKFSVLSKNVSKIWAGDAEDYYRVSTHNDNTIYCVLSDGIYLGDKVIIRDISEGRCFEMVALDPSTISVLRNDNLIQYSTNKIDWSNVINYVQSWSLNPGEKLYLRGVKHTNKPPIFNTTGKISVRGNLNSLIDFTQNDLGSKFVLSPSCYDSMFWGFYDAGLSRDSSGLYDVSELILPATTLADYCYRGMFRGCTNLTNAPQLPATTLADFCYDSMFYECTNLTNAPQLPATTLADCCYRSMFYGCTNLTSATPLPALTLAENCYDSMFYGCTNLTSAPDLLADTLVNSCYAYMFYGCTNLNYIRCLATVLVDDPDLLPTGAWVYGVANTGTFVKNVNTNWTTGNSGIPNNWTVINNN